MTDLICPNGAGSLNNPDAPGAQTGLNNPSLIPYKPAENCMGDWEMSGLAQDDCAVNDQQRQEDYVAESLNIAGAPINIFRLLGVHEQGDGSLLSSASVIASQAYPGYPITGINSGGAWRSIQAGSSIANVAYVGVDFGIKTLPNIGSEYAPQKQKWTKVGAINLTQGVTPNEFARQVKVEIADGLCEVGLPFFSGVGDGTLTSMSPGVNASQGTVTLMALTPTTFNAFATLQDGSVIGLNYVTVGVPFSSIFLNLTLNQGLVPFVAGDMFSIPMNYVWKRQGIFNLVQSPLPQLLNFSSQINVKAIRVTPTLFTGIGSWEVTALDVLDSPKSSIDNIQDLFFNENRDRDYALEPILIKAQYSPLDGVSDLSRFGLSMADQYSFTVSFSTMVQLLGRPIVTGDVIEVIPEMQYDHNLKPVRKFLEVSDTGWAAEGFSTSWRPTVYRFSAQQALPSQELRDIFGTLDSQKYLVADSISSDGIGEQLDTSPLTITEEIIKDAANAVPETGSDDQRSTMGQPLPPIQNPTNAKGQPAIPPFSGRQNTYIEDGLPKNGEPYGEGFILPDTAGVADGDYFRLYYKPEVKIAPRLYRYSAVKNRWLFLEQDKRGNYSSHKPSVRNILQSDTRQGLGKKTL